MTKLCVARLYAETHDPPEPAEWCPREALPFADHCGEHLYLDKDAQFDDPDPYDDEGWSA